MAGPAGRPRHPAAAALPADVERRCAAPSTHPHSAHLAALFAPGRVLLRWPPVLPGSALQGRRADTARARACRACFWCCSCCWRMCSQPCSAQSVSAPACPSPCHGRGQVGRRAACRSRPLAARRRAAGRAAPLAAGRERTLDDIACRGGRMLGELLECSQFAQRLRGSARVRGMRHIYTVLHWVLQRIEEQVRARGARAPQAEHARGSAADRACTGRRRRPHHGMPACMHGQLVAAPPVSPTSFIVTPALQSLFVSVWRDQAACYPRPTMMRLHPMVSQSAVPVAGKGHSLSLSAPACARASARRRTRPTRAGAPTQRRAASVRACCSTRTRAPPAASRPGCCWCDLGMRRNARKREAHALRWLPTWCKAAQANQAAACSAAIRQS